MKVTENIYLQNNLTITGQAKGMLTTMSNKKYQYGGQVHVWVIIWTDNESSYQLILWLKEIEIHDKFRRNHKSGKEDSQKHFAI